MPRSDLQNGAPFDFTVLPSVVSVSPNSGNQGGQLLTIKGSGFSQNIKNNSVSVDGNDCKVTSVDRDTLKCTLQAQDHTTSSKLSTTSASQQNGYFSGSGLEYARYNIGTPASDMPNFISKVRLGTFGTPV